MARSNRLVSRMITALLGCTLTACEVDSADQQAHGSLALALSTEAGGVEYQLSHARFSLEGPVRMDFTGGDQQSMLLELPVGAYSLSLLEGYGLTDEGGSAVAARLVSANPAPVLISAGDTAQLTLRFELDAAAPSGTGHLGIDLSVTPSSGGPACEGLRINELDYEQLGADEGEFIEVLNTLPCEASLASVVLELVNGGDGKVYTRYDLSQVASSLPGNGRLVLGDEAIVAGLGPQVAHALLNGSGLQNGPDGVRLLRGEQLLDSLAYEATFGDFGASAAPADEAAQALGRCPDGFDSGDSSVDFRLLVPTPGAPNSCG